MKSIPLTAMALATSVGQRFAAALGAGNRGGTPLPKLSRSARNKLKNGRQGKTTQFSPNLGESASARRLRQMSALEAKRLAKAAK